MMHTTTASSTQRTYPQSPSGSGREDRKKIYDWRLLTRIFAYILPHKKYLALALVTLFAGTFFQLTRPYLLKKAVDIYVQNHSAALPTLYTIVLLFFFALLGDFGAGYVQLLSMARMGQQVMHDLRMAIFEHLQKMALQYFDHHPVGRLMTRVINDVEVLQELLSSGVVEMIGDLVTLFFALIIMLYLDWQLTVVLLLLTPVLIGMALLFRPKMRILYRLIREKLSALNAYMQENLNGLAIVQTFRREELNSHYFQQINQEHLHANLQATFLEAIFFPLIQVVNSLAIALLLWYGGGRVIRGTADLGTLVAFVYYFQLFARPLLTFGTHYNILQRAMASAERIFTLLDTTVRVRNPRYPIAVNRLKGAISFQHVWCAYQPQEWILRDVSFQVEPGEKVALVGATGAGKTSVIRLLSRLYEFQRGRITLDGIDIRKIDRRVLQRNIGVVLQDFHLFSDTVTENIRLWNQDIPLERVREVCKYVHADAFIQRLPFGYHTRMHEKGSTLSFGQRQLLSFARVLAFAPQILVLDEATSHVDTETELLIQDALQKLLEGRTALIIAHRLLTIHHVNRILVFHKGQIIESGTHDTLLRAGGMYHHLYQLQFQD